MRKFVFEKLVSITLIVSMIMTTGGFATLADSIPDVVETTKIQSIDQTDISHKYYDDSAGAGEDVGASTASPDVEEPEEDETTTESDAESTFIKELEDEPTCELLDVESDEAINQDDDTMSTETDSTEVIEMAEIELLVATNSKTSEELFGSGTVHNIRAPWWGNTNIEEVEKVVFQNGGTIPTYTSDWEIDSYGSNGLRGYYNSDSKVITVYLPAGDTLKTDTAYYFFSGHIDFMNPKSFLNLETIENMDLIDFSECSSLDNMFRGCSKFTSLDLSDLNTSNIRYMSGMFRDCTNLTSLNISNFDTNNVTSMAEMFRNCSNLTSLDLSNFDTSNVSAFDYMFHGCSNLESLDLSNFVTSNLTNMGHMFQDCSNLTSLNLSGLDLSNASVTNIFYGCTSLEQVDLSNAKLPSGCGSLFYINANNENNKINTINLSNCDTSNVTNMNNMFSGLSFLPSIDLSSFNTSNVTNMVNMFSGCSILSHMVISEGISNRINDQGLKGNWRDLAINITYNYDNGNDKTTIPSGGGEYQRVNYYTITYQTNGGDIIIPQMYDAGTSANFTIPTRTGYLFKGWYSEPELINKYESNHVDSIDRDYVLYAKWDPITYTIGFNTDGGSSIEPQYKRNGELIDRPPNPTKAGYIFVDWYKEMSRTNLFDFSVPVSAHTTLYAKWREPTGVQHEVSFDMQGHGSQIEPQFITDGGRATRPQDPTADGYVFAGWYKENTHKNLWNFDNDIVAEPTIIYAKWELITYTITYYENHGTWAGGYIAPASYSIADASSKNLPTNANIARNHYIFDGWYEHSDFSGSEVTTLVGLLTDLNLYAKWIVGTDPHHTITFESGGGSGSMDSQLAFEGEETILDANVFTKEGFTFNGWSSSDGRTFTNGQNIGEVTEDLTLTATWIKNVSPTPAPYYPPSGGGGTGGGGGGGGGRGGTLGVNDGMNNNQVLRVTEIQTVMLVAPAINEEDVSWHYDPVSNRFSLSISVNGIEILARDVLVTINENNSTFADDINMVKTSKNSYFFDANGYLTTGWIRTIDNKWYFFENAKTANEGRMVVGWKHIGDNWYYFASNGEMLVNSVTPDGYFVRADGTWVQS